MPHGYGLGPGCVATYPDLPVCLGVLGAVAYLAILALDFSILSICLKSLA